MAGRNKNKQPCQTINKTNKLPCKAKGIYCKTTKKYRCRMHGGWSRGQTTIEGKIKAYKNLPQFKNLNDEEIRTYIRDKQRNRKNADERNASNANMRKGWFTKSFQSV